MDNIIEVAHDELTRECDYEQEARNQMELDIYHHSNLID